MDVYACVQVCQGRGRVGRTSKCARPCIGAGLQINGLARVYGPRDSLQCAFDPRVPARITTRNIISTD